MLKKHILIKFLKQLSKELQTDLLDQIDMEPPALGNDGFINWMMVCRKKLNLTQEKMASDLKIRQEEISKFENGKTNFSLKRLTKIHNYLIKKINEGHALAHS